MTIFNELKRRNVFRVALAYVVLSWLLMQVADVLFGALELPSAWNKGIIAVLLIGFIPTLMISWVYEMTPEGLKRESEVDRTKSITPHTAHKLNIAVLVMLALAITLFVSDRFLNDRPAAPATIAAAPATEAAPVSESVPVVAVLPLQALSTEDEGRFLASGLHDDLLTRLARLEAFRVISRTSVMEYADTTRNLREIGQELGAGYIVEGGLQAIGGRVRINAQLIDAATDEHLWAETFERPLTSANLFAVQAEIATAIADSLHATLSPQDVEKLEEVPTENLAAYQAYMRGNASYTSLSRPALYASKEAFAEATSLDPQFGEAWAQLARIYVQLYWEEGGETGTGADPAWRDASLEALEKAETLDPEGILTLLARSYYYYYGFRDYSAALIALGRAEAVAPNHVHTIALRGFLLRRLGRMDESSDTLLRVIEADRNFSLPYSQTTITLVTADRCDEALQVVTEGLRRFPDNSDLLIAGAGSIALCRNDFPAAREIILKLEVTTAYELENKFYLLALTGDISAATQSLEETSASVLSNPVAGLMAANRLAWGYRAMGQEAAARTAQDRATRLAGDIEGGGSGLLVEKAFTAALQGDRDAALKLGREALETSPPDALRKPVLRRDVIRAWAMAGAPDEALEQAAILKQEFSKALFAALRIDPFLTPLQEHPGFIALFTDD